MADLEALAKTAVEAAIGLAVVVGGIVAAIWLGGGVAGTRISKPTAKPGGLADREPDPAHHAEGHFPPEYWAALRAGDKGKP